MDMEKVIVGPPGYGSPDPRTSAGKLVTLDQHPNADMIDADYGKDVTPEDVEAAKPEHLQGQEESNSDSLSEMTKAELQEMAKERGVDGYSTMNKAELVEALSDES